MKYIRQFTIILAFSFVGELLNHFIPLPIPASIYGIILLFLCLQLKILSLDSIKETGKFLIEIMPVMFIPAAVGILDSWNVIKPLWIQYIIITIISTVIVMIVSGRVAQAIIHFTDSLPVKNTNRTEVKHHD